MGFLDRGIGGPWLPAGGLPRRARWGLGAAAAVLALPFAQASLAQTASQITPPSFQMELPRLGGAVVFSGAPGLEAPPGAERLSVALSGVTIEGGLPAMAAAGTALEDRLVGRRVPVSELFAAAQDLERAYAQAGYVLARVVLPAQELNDGGRLRLVVVDGFVERVEDEGVPDRVRPRVQAMVAPLVGQRGLTLAEIERRLLLAGDTPGIALRSTLGPGDAAGGAALSLEADYRPVTGFVGLDNTLADDLGTWTLAAGLEFNSLLGKGELFYLRASGYPGGDDGEGLGGFFTGYPRTRTLIGGAMVPIGANGLTLTLEGTRSQTTPEPAGGLQTASEFERLSFRLDYPWIRSRDLNVNAALILDATSENQRGLLGDRWATLSSDRLRVVRAASDARKPLASGGVLSGGAILSFGLDAFGARDETIDPGTAGAQVIADAAFQKLEVVALYQRPLREHVALALFARAQTSFGQSLPTSEQIGFASFGELATFDTGVLGGDAGWILRGDLQSPWSFTYRAFPIGIMPYAFAATGMLRLEDPTAFEEARLRVSSVGVGVELTSVFAPNFSDATLALQYGRAYRDDALPDENRLSLVGSYRF